jgi:hypothetical protein
MFSTSNIMVSTCKIFLKKHLAMKLVNNIPNFSLTILFKWTENFQKGNLLIISIRMWITKTAYKQPYENNDMVYSTLQANICIYNRYIYINPNITKGAMVNMTSVAVCLSCSKYFNSIICSRINKSQLLCNRISLIYS